MRCVMILPCDDFGWIKLQNSFISYRTLTFSYAIAKISIHQIVCFRGPLFICLSLALILSTKAPTKQTSHVFTTVFIVMWVGALIVTVNAQLLGASISIFQSLCVRTSNVTLRLPNVNDIPNFVHRSGVGLLCLSINCIGARHCNIKIYMARHNMVGFDMAITGAVMGNTGFLYLRRAIC